MPILEPKPGGGHDAKATLRGVVVTFHLTAQGEKRLFDSGINPGVKFPLALLADLAQQGLAWTSPSANAAKAGIHFAQQFDLNLAGDETAERLFPACSEDGSYNDLHLVAWKAGPALSAKLLCGECRLALRHRALLSVPVSVLSLNILSLLESQGKLPAGSPVTIQLREAYRADLAADWERFRRQSTTQQVDLGLALPGELGLRLAE